MLACLCATAARAQDSTLQGADDAFGSRIGDESVGLYSESLVRGFDLQQAGNYRMEEAYFVRSAAPTDAIVAGSQIRVGASALALGFPAPSGIVQYRLLPGDRDRARLELGFQHLLDDNPRPYLRGFFTRRTDDGRYSLSGGVLGTPSARYMFGNQARYHGIGLVPRARLGDDWQLVAFYGMHDQEFQSDIGFVPADGARMPQPDRLHYLGQPWSRFQTRNSSYGAIASTPDRRNAWDYSLSAIGSKVDRPRSDFNLLSDVQENGDAHAAVIVARDRKIDSRAFEGVARRDWTALDRRNELALLARARISAYRSPRTQFVSVGPVSMLGVTPAIDEPDPGANGPQNRNRVEQRELGAGWQFGHRDGFALNLGLRRVHLDEATMPAGATPTGRASAEWLYNAAVVAPLSRRLTAFAATTRGIEETGAAPHNASNRFEILPPVLARQSELGMQWQAGSGVSVLGTLFEITKPEPGFDADGEYRFLDEVTHRGVEMSLAGEVVDDLRVVAGMSWMRMRLDGERVRAGEIAERPVGRPARLALASFEYAPSAWRGVSIDADATYTGERAADDLDRNRTPGYTLINVGARYRFTLGKTPAQLRLRAYNATDKYVWIADGSGTQSWEPSRRLTLSLTLGQ